MNFLRPIVLDLARDGAGITANAFLNIDNHSIFRHQIAALVQLADANPNAGIYLPAQGVEAFDAGWR